MSYTDGTKAQGDSIPDVQHGHWIFWAYSWDPLIIAKGIHFKIPLLIHNAPGHPRALMGMYNEINVAFMPAGTISIVYPMDQGVILTFKSYYLRNTFCTAATPVGGDFSDGSQQHTLQIFWKEFTILDAAINMASGMEVKVPTLTTGIWKKAESTSRGCVGWAQEVSGGSKCEWGRSIRKNQKWDLKMWLNFYKFITKLEQISLLFLFFKDVLLSLLCTWGCELV